MAIGDQVRRIANEDMLVFDSAGNVIGIRSGRSSGEEGRMLSPDDWDSVQAMVSGAGIVISVSRSALAADNGATLELATGVTYTLTDSVALPAGVILQGPSSGSATLAVDGAATINAATSSLTVGAGQVFAAIPRASNAAAYIVKGS